MYKALCLFRDQFAHIKPVEEKLSGKVEFLYTDNWTEQEILNTRPDIIIGINEHHLDLAKCYAFAKKNGIPTLTLQDGILEWRHMFENPLFDGEKNGVPLHNPVIADKIACIGPWWHYLISTLGNPRKVELTGMPKMDILGDKVISLIKRSKYKILILTAAKPWFTDDQKPIVVKMLSDLKEFFDRNSEYVPIWRVTKQLDLDLKLENRFSRKDSTELKILLDECDAVIGTTSTAMIESMLLGKPVAKIDYFNKPALFPTVWNITNKDQLEDQIYKLTHHTPMEAWLQDAYKGQVILRTKSATHNTAELILFMINFNITYPNKELPTDICLNSILSKSELQSFNTGTFYSQRQSITTNELEFIRQKLIRAEHEIDILNNKVDSNSISKTLLRLGRGIFREKRF